VFILTPSISTLALKYAKYIPNFDANALFTGREVIWPYVLEVVFDHPLSMRVDEVVLDHYGGDLGAHNAWLDIAWKYSLPVAVLFLIAIFNMGKWIVKKSNTPNSSVLISCFICGLIHMSFETSIISGALDYTLYFFIALLGGVAIIGDGKESVK
jgi:hypothetical protein